MLYIPKVYYFELQPQEIFKIFFTKQIMSPALATINCPICYEINTVCTPATRTHKMPTPMSIDACTLKDSDTIFTSQDNWQQKAASEIISMYPHMINVYDDDSINVFILKKNIDNNMCQIGCFGKVAKARKSKQTFMFDSTFEQIIKMKAFW